LKKSEILVILNNPYSPYADTAENKPANQLVLTLIIDDGFLNAATIRAEVARTHDIIPESVILFHDYQHLSEIKEDDLIGQKVYWAFEGDSPSNWNYKRDIVLGSLDRIEAIVTENMSTSSFLLEKDFQWGDDRSDRQTRWRDMTYDTDNNPHIPLLVDNGHYLTAPNDIRDAYYTTNQGWFLTLQDVQRRLRLVQTDRAQYETNMQHLEQNDHQLRERIRLLSGHLFPPFPDTSLYSSILNNGENQEPGFPVIPDLTWKMLLSSIDANTLYHHQELGKYNLLKKEECHLLCVIQQLRTRMKLWIFRDRIRMIQWEINHILNSNDVIPVPNPIGKELTVIKSKPIEHRKEDVDKRKRSYQCIDFCQCDCCLLKAKKDDDPKKLF
jgi:hypothetical protein